MREEGGREGEKKRVLILNEKRKRHETRRKEREERKIP